MQRRTLLTAVVVLSASPTLVFSRDALAESAISGTLYKNPDCTCCEEYAKYLSRNGYMIRVVSTDDLPAVKRQHGVLAQLEGCHTLVVGKYVVEGHVPYKHIDRLLAEKPDIGGISLPGMPMGSPGMAAARRRRSRFTKSGTMRRGFMRSTSNIDFDIGATRRGAAHVRRVREPFWSGRRQDSSPDDRPASVTRHAAPRSLARQLDASR